MFRMLLAEDNVVFRRTLQSLLTEQFPSLELLEAGNGRDAILVVEAWRPNLVLLDIKLPDESGLNLTRRIKDVDTDIEVVILTSHDLPEYRQAAFRSGASGFLCKDTASPDDIIALIQGTMATCHLD